MLTTCTHAFNALIPTPVHTDIQTHRKEGERTREEEVVMKPDAVVMSVIPTLVRLRQEDQESHATLSFK